MQTHKMIRRSNDAAKYLFKCSIATTTTRQYSSINKRGMIWSKYDTEETQQSDTSIHRHSKKIDEMIRVDHAGEFGAVVIAKSQLFVLPNDPTLHEILSQEVDHYNTFEELIHERRVRPTAMRPIWSVAGTFAGVVTAALGRESAMACHKAVEEVISNHYNEQLRDLYDMNDQQSAKEKEFEFEQELQFDEITDASNEEYFFSSNRANQVKEEELRKHIRQFRDDEMHHHNLAEQNRAMESPFYNLIYNTVKAGCSAAIWLTKRV
jgi:ubiquinone biosynthesis monooxygenase Coq7